MNQNVSDRELVPDRPSHLGSPSVRPRRLGTDLSVAALLVLDALLVLSEPVPLPDFLGRADVCGCLSVPSLLEDEDGTITSTSGSDRRRVYALGCG